jgi:para-aminobenzoate synthetase component 1
MRRRGPVPFAAYLQLDGLAACCASPELYLQKRGERLISDPIKGTRPRGDTPEQDEQICMELQSNLKERAENLMIVDLVRNDFSRVCEAGSVRVSKLFEIQKFATVFQMVSRVEGMLKPSVPPEEALAACFPMGSMTGAPKIRAMELIEQIETYRRGLYSGAIGFFTPEGDFTFNVVIRTAIIRDDKLLYATGGAITADSDPESEWEETWIKARALGATPER